MHMADAQISPAVGATMWAVNAGLLAWCARKIRQTLDDRLVPLMGVLGAFIFAAQMINFSIPFTGSSGHLGGGMILAVLLGPYAAFIVIASVLMVQALFFADGGLLALGCNIVNLGFFPAFIAYPFIYRPIAGNARNGARIWLGAMLAAIAGLQMGAFGVVIETTLSGISDLSFRSFVLLMQPIHLAIGIGEGLATASVVSFVLRARPAAGTGTEAASCGDRGGWHRVVLALLLVTVVVGAGLSWFASTHPDGLEWAMARAGGKAEPDRAGAGIHETLANLQEKTAFLPEYGFKAAGRAVTAAPAPAAKVLAPWPSVSTGTSLSGLVGGLLTLMLAGVIGYGLTRRFRTGFVSVSDTGKGGS